MTTVTATGLTGAGETVARGYLRFTPTTAWGAPAMSLPPSQTVKIEDGDAQVTIAPSGIGWAWAVTFQILGLQHWTKYYLVPDVPSIALSALTEVDPMTLAPGAEPDPAWYEYVDAIVAGQVGKVEVITGAEARPGFGSVLWIGGTTEPVNMVQGVDIWFKETA